MNHVQLVLLHSLKRMRHPIMGRGRGRGYGNGRGRGRGGSFKNSYSHQKRDNKDNNKQEKDKNENVTNVCYRCGGKGHWSRTCRTPKHLVDLYQQSLKQKGKRVQRASTPPHDYIT